MSNWELRSKLYRGFRYICRALSTMQQHPELELHVCFKRAYDDVLKQHHSAFVRTLVAVSVARAGPPERCMIFDRWRSGPHRAATSSTVGLGRGGRWTRRWASGLQGWRGS